MDPHGSGRATGQGPPPPSSSSGAGALPNEPAHGLSHRIASISDFSDYDTFDAYQSAAVLQHLEEHQNRQQQAGTASASSFDPQPTLRGRESLVSIDSLVYDPSINAYTRNYNAVPATASTAPATIPASAASNTETAPVATAAPLQYVDSPVTAQAGSGEGWTVPAPAPTAVSTPYTTYDADAIVSTAGGHPSAGQEPANSPSGGTISRQLGHMFSRRKPNSRRSTAIHQTIPEDETYDGSRESIDMASLVQNAAPMGSLPSLSKAYSPLAKQDDENADDGDVPRSAGGGDVPVDVTTFFGPATSQDEAFIKSLQEQEANGKLTLGLGAGFGPGTKLKESELLANAASISGPGATAISPVRGASLRRTFSRRFASSSSTSASSPLSPIASSRSPTSPHQLSRQGTLRALAQSEANRRGEIVEVIMEEDEEEDVSGHDASASKVDLSVVSGPEGPDSLADGGMTAANRRQTTFPLRAATTLASQKTQVFYPQPNWRPFSMRWPYLLSLILLSVGLGIAQELIFRMSVHEPLVKFHSPSEIPGGIYFAVKFAPTLIAVTFGVLWQVTDFEVKRLEAFYQMSKENGAVADESINVDYVTYFTFFRPFRALYCKHYAVAVSSIASLLAVSLVPTLGAAAIVLTPDRATRLKDPQGEKQVTISPVWSRFLTVIFFVIAALGCVLFWLLQRRRSGLLSDVKGIAGLASMAVVSHIMTDFKDMDVATHKDIHHKLKDRRYVLRNSSLAPDDENVTSLRERERHRESHNHLSQNPHPLMLRARGCIPYIAGILLFAALIPTVLFTPANVLTDKAAWLLTALAVGIKLGWGGLETSVRMMEPYYILSRRHAPPKTLTLDYTAMPFMSLALQALRNGHLLVFFVGFGTVMTELLTILVTSLATVEGHDFVSWSERASDGVDSGEETAGSFWLTLALVTFILGYMSIVAAVVFARRRRPFLPRQPNTIASVLAFIHQSKMLWSFVGTSKMNNTEMLERLEALGHTYGLGWFEGRDGQTHCGVDQEELMSSYKLGYDYSQSNKPWIDRPVEWL